MSKNHFVSLLSGSLFLAMVASVAGSPVLDASAVDALSAGGGEGEPKVTVSFPSGNVPEGSSLKLIQAPPEEGEYGEAYRLAQREAGEGPFSVWGLYLENADGSRVEYHLPVDVSWEATGSGMPSGDAKFSMVGVWDDGSFLDVPVTGATEALSEDGSLYVSKFTCQPDGLAGAYVLLDSYSTGWVSFVNEGDHAIALDLSIDGNSQAGSRGYKVCFDGKPSRKQACDGSRLVLSAGQEAVLHGVPDGATVEAVYSGVDGNVASKEGVSRKVVVTGGKSGGAVFTGKELSQNGLSEQDEALLDKGRTGTLSDGDVSDVPDDAHDHGVGVPDGNTVTDTNGEADGNTNPGSTEVSDSDGTQDGKEKDTSGDEATDSDGRADAPDKKDLGEDTKKESPDTGLVSFFAVFAALAVVCLCIGSCVLAYRHGCKSAHKRR